MIPTRKAIRHIVLLLLFFSAWGLPSSFAVAEEPADPESAEESLAEAVVPTVPALDLSEASNGSAPVRIRIPSIGLDTTVVAVGTDPDGAMSSPENPDTVAWYSLGPGVGAGGNIVLAGHVDWNGRLRAFGSLRLLREGDEITIWDAEGAAETYLVDSHEMVDAETAPVEEIFASDETPRVTLITCGGAFDPFARQYLHRLVVRANRASES